MSRSRSSASASERSAQSPGCISRVSAEIIIDLQRISVRVCVTVSIQKFLSRSDILIIITLADDFTDSGAGTHKWTKIGIVVIVYRGRNRHNVEIAVTYLLNVAGAEKAMVVDGIL